VPRMQISRSMLSRREIALSTLSTSMLAPVASLMALMFAPPLPITRAMHGELTVSVVIRRRDSSMLFHMMSAPSSDGSVSLLAVAELDRSVDDLSLRAFLPFLFALTHSSCVAAAPRGDTIGDSTEWYCCCCSRRVGERSCCDSRGCGVGAAAAAECSEGSTAADAPLFFPLSFLLLLVAALLSAAVFAVLDAGCCTASSAAAAAGAGAAGGRCRPGMRSSARSTWRSGVVSGGDTGAAAAAAAA
ncbi:hypothetical protein PFISCL1PPCAC_13956, partial [Pristionchus fissidentatus]